MKPCKHCKFYRPGWDRDDHFAQCASPRALGNRAPGIATFCFQERNPWLAGCGVRGRYFEPRTAMPSLLQRITAWFRGSK